MNDGSLAWMHAVAAGRRYGGWRTRLIAVIAVAAVTGCGTTGGGLTKDSPAALKEKVVAERVNGRWQALIKRDYEAAYEYMSAASREATSMPKFAEKIKTIQYRAATIDRIECAAEVCKVTLSVTYDFPPAKAQGVVTPLDESWIIDQGQAWFVFRG